MDASQTTTSRQHRIWTWVNDPWVQGIGTGLGALVPARSYPGWLRQALIWVPSVGLGTLVATPATWRALARSAGAERTPDPAVEKVPEPAEPEQRGPASPTRRWLGRGAGAVLVGTVVYGTMRVAFWLDGAAERGLRRLHVPAPRVTMAVGAGAGAAWLAKKQDPRDQASVHGSVPSAELDCDVAGVRSAGHREPPEREAS